jgi:hypothetical protein
MSRPGTKNPSNTRSDSFWSGHPASRDRAGRKEVDYFSFSSRDAHILRIGEAHTTTQGWGQIVNSIITFSFSSNYNEWINDKMTD